MVAFRIYKGGVRVINEIGVRVGEVIRALGMKKVRFAEQIGVDQSYMTKLSKGAGQPSDLLITSICREFNVNEKWLRTGEGEMFNPTPDRLIDEITYKYQLSDIGRELIEVYLTLDQADRTGVECFIHNLFEKWSLRSTQPSQSDKEIEQEVERYRQDLLAKRDTNNIEVALELTPPVPDVMSELAEVKRQNREMAQQNQELTKQNKEFLMRLEILEKEENEKERRHTKQSIFPARSHTQ